jgi:hypothetical protein
MPSTNAYTLPTPTQVERALLDLCLDPSDSFLAAVGVDMGSSLAEGSVTSSVRLYEVCDVCHCWRLRGGAGWAISGTASCFPSWAVCTGVSLR